MGGIFGFSIPFRRRPAQGKEKERRKFSAARMGSDCRQLYQLVGLLDYVSRTGGFQLLPGAEAPQHPAAGQAGVAGGEDVHIRIPHKQHPASCKIRSNTDRMI